MISKLQSRVKQVRSNISVMGLGTQAYDPELLAIDKNANVITGRRLAAGFGAPPMAPYAGQMLKGLWRPPTGAPSLGITLPPGLGLRQQLPSVFPIIASFPRLLKLFQ